MFARVRLLHLALIGAGTAAGLWVLAPPPLPAPPDLTAAGFVSVRATFRGPSGREWFWNADSADPDLVRGLTESIRDGRPVLVCRCATIGKVTLERADGTKEVFNVVPAHDPGAVEFRYGPGRFRMNRERFMKLVEPLGLAPHLWYRGAGSADWPQRDPALMAVVGGVLGADPDGGLWMESAP